MSLDQAKLYDVVRHPVITEKATLMNELNKYVFKVSSRSNKVSVKSAVESIFNVKVVSVNILNTKGKVKKFKGRKGYRSGYKKAIVTLADSNSIDFGGKV